MGRGWGLGGWARWVMGIQEGIFWDEHWVWYVRDESLNSTPETSIALYGHQVKFKLKNKKTVALVGLGI